MKRIVAMLLAALVVASLAVGCGRDESSSVAPGSSSSASQGSSASQEAEPTLEELHTAVKNAYGDNYLPSMSLDATAMTEQVGLTMDNVEEFIAEGPMISAHVDTFIAIKAKEGKGADVETELNAYRDYLVSESLQYPGNMAKVNASRVFRHGDYVFFIMLGAMNDAAETDEEAATFAEEQTQIAVDAIEAVFNGEEPPVAEKAGSDVSSAVSDAGDAVSDAVSDAGDAVSDAVSGAGDAISDAGSAVSDAASDVGEVLTGN